MATTDQAQAKRASQLDKRELALDQRKLELDGKEKAVDLKLEQSEKLLDSLTTQIVVLEAKKDHLAAHNEKENLFLDHLMEREAELDKKHTAAKDAYAKEIATLQATLKDIKAVIADRRTEAATVNKELQDGRDYLKQQEETVQGVIEAYNIQLASSNERIDQLTKQEATLKESIETLEDYEQDTKKRIFEAQETLETIARNTQKAQETYEKNITVMRTNIQRAQTTISDLEAQAEKQQEEMSQFTKWMTEERSKIDRGRAALERKERELSDERRRIESNRAVLGSL